MALSFMSPYAWCPDCQGYDTGRAFMTPVKKVLFFEYMENPNFRFDELLGDQEHVMRCTLNECT